MYSLPLILLFIVVFINVFFAFLSGDVYVRNLIQGINDPLIVLLAIVFIALIGIVVIVVVTHTIYET